MKTYRYRFRFHISSKGLIQGEEKSTDFTLPNGMVATLHCIDSDKFSDSTKFALISGGYSSEEEAFFFGEQIKESVLCYGTKFRVGVDVGKDKTTGFIGKIVKDEVLRTHGVRIIDDIHGISVYDEEHPVSCGSVSGAILINARDKTFFLDEVCKLMSSRKTINAKTRLAMELLTASFFESSPRSRFLTLILAAEALLEPDERTDKVKLFVDELKGYTEASYISTEEKASILGTLNLLYKDSISQSLKKMAALYLGEIQFDNLSASKFISNCYDARSKLVHTGCVDESKYHIGSLGANLEVYLMYMLCKIAGL